MVDKRAYGNTSTCVFAAGSSQRPDRITSPRSHSRWIVRASRPDPSSRQYSPPSDYPDVVTVSAHSAICWISHPTHRCSPDPASARSIDAHAPLNPIQAIPDRPRSSPHRDPRAGRLRTRPRPRPPPVRPRLSLSRSTDDLPRRLGPDRRPVRLPDDRIRIPTSCSHPYTRGRRDPALSRRLPVIPIVHLTCLCGSRRPQRSSHRYLPRMPCIFPRTDRGRDSRRRPSM